MSRQLTPRTTLEHLKTEAKRWLKALRADDPEARGRFERLHPEAPADPPLRAVQHALAREFGFPGWAALKQALANATTAGPARDVLSTRFLDNACPDHHVRGGPDHVRAEYSALRILARYPDIAHANLYTSIVCGDLTRVERALAEQPELASRKGTEPTTGRSGAGGSGDLVRSDLGPKGWEPLLYLCFTRLSLPAVSENAVAIARTLLDHGADPTVYFMAGGSRYTPLVGVIGRGEEDRPPHPERDALVGLLLERGADPYDNQVIYNIHFDGDVLWFLELAHARSVQLGRHADWDDPEWSMLNMGGYGTGARWHLDIAIKNDNLELTQWCLAHGANPNSAPARDPRFPQGSLYEEAGRKGRREIAELLAGYGARVTAVDVNEIEAFVEASLRLDREEVERQLARHPEFLRATEPLFSAIEQDRVDVAELLLDLGTSPDVENKAKQRPLHWAAYNDAVRCAELLIARGAEIDPVETDYGGTPLGAAVYCQSLGVIELLGSYSRDLWQLVYLGQVERLRELLTEQPERGRVVSDGYTPLMWLPTRDEQVAIEVARLLMAYGANPSLRDRQGVSAADRAERNGMFDLAALLRAEAETTTTQEDDANTG